MDTPPSIPATTTIVVMGVSGSGKTSAARELTRQLGWEYIEGDDLHPAANVAKMAAGTPLDDDDRWPWLREIAAVIGEHEAAGTDLVITCSALKRSYRDLLRDGHPSVWFAHVDVPREVLAERLAQRKGHFMPPSLLDSQLATLERLGEDEPGDVIAGDAPLEETVAKVLGDLREERQLQS
ncbi:gluconokinase [Modestobacter versicolor]|uniref:Gluconokinase n=1 Tax=Modestobacter versicolor TaxID=429133 RepID=A0A323V9A8_9ACTN|nr:gluconokinase [Modestobacter versicolor]MBB3676071.1 gluconokinase [Modestobacter versicolor]PZA21412.1 gluconokinase [Modestobacter versicolor]